MTRLDQLSGKKSAQTATSNWADQMRAQGAEILAVQGFAEAIELVVQGRADATANDIVSFTTYLDEKPDASFRLLDQELPDQAPICVILRQGQDPLREAVDGIIGDLKADGTLRGIYETWVGTDLTPQD